MSIRSIVTYPDPRLRTICEPVDVITEETIELLNDMAETMHAANGIGLAAPQVGVLKRIFVVDVGQGVYDFINPTILTSNGTELGGDGCLSIPGISGESYRSYELTVRAQNRTGEWFELTATGMFARCIQHEYDHLDGVLFIDKVMRLYEDQDEEENEAMQDHSNQKKSSIIPEIMKHANDFVTDDIRTLIVQDYKKQALALDDLLQQNPNQKAFKFPNEWEIDRSYLQDDLKYMNRVAGISIGKKTMKIHKK